jgi:hypothetical protein
MMCCGYKLFDYLQAMDENFHYANEWQLSLQA